MQWKFHYLTIQISDILHQYWEHLDDNHEITPTNDALPENTQAIKFVDYASVQEAVNLLENLTLNERNLEKILPKENTLMHAQIDLIKKLSDEREMSLNSGKTKLLIVKFTHNHQFKPLLQVPGSSNPLKTVAETKLLGYTQHEDTQTCRIPLRSILQTIMVNFKTKESMGA